MSKTKANPDVARRKALDANKARAIAEGDCILAGIERTAAVMVRRKVSKAKAAHTSGKGYRTPTVSGSSKRAGSKARSVNKDRKEGGFIASTEAYARLLALLNS